MVRILLAFLVFSGFALAVVLQHAQKHSVCFLSFTTQGPPENKACEETEEKGEKVRLLLSSCDLLYFSHFIVNSGN